MKIFHFNKTLIYVFIINIQGCTGFLDWNQNYLYEENEKAKNLGYIFHGENEKAIEIANKCKTMSQNSIEQNNCLLNNGFEKPK